MAGSKDRRLYARLDIGFDEHDKIFPLSDAAFRALVEMTLYSRRQLTDGFLAERMAVKRWTQPVIDELSSNDPERPSLIAVKDGWMIHDFAEHQTTNADIEAKREAGAKGAAKRWASSSDGAPIAPAMGDPMRIDGGTLAKTETETDTSKRTTAPAVLVSESDFERAWSHWPKKVERKKSLDKFRQLAKHHDLEKLIADIIRFGDAYSRSTERQFVPALVVWLNGERWTDELPGSNAKPFNPVRPPAPEGRRYAVDVASGVPLA